MNAIPAIFANRRDVSVELGKLVEGTKECQRGELITYGRIKELTGMVRSTDGRQTPGWQSLIRKWRKAMELRGIVISPRAISNEGYRLLTVEEQEAAGDKFGKQARKSLGRQAVCYGTLDQDELEPAVRRRLIGKLGQVTEAGQLFARHKTERRNWLTKKDSLPRVAGPDAEKTE